MPNISYFNPVFEDDNKNVTLIRAERNAIWDYDKAERRHKSTNVLTYRVNIPFSKWCSGGEILKIPLR